jgi:hypothetical protein
VRSRVSPPVPLSSVSLRHGCLDRAGCLRAAIACFFGMPPFLLDDERRAVSDRMSLNREVQQMRAT